MPLFSLGPPHRINPSEFKREKDLQQLVEQNLKLFFNCRFIASEFSTGNIHSGRIDTLALSEEGNPVIIEYKKTASSDLINQSLYYLHWLLDHRGDFQMAAHRALGPAVEVDWSDIRVICLAPEFKRYDVHAVQVMGANIELWEYRLYEDGFFDIKEVHQRSTPANSQLMDKMPDKNPVMVEAGHKAWQARVAGSWEVEDHLKSVPGTVRELFMEIRDYIVGLDESIVEIPRKRHIAYRTSQNFACIVVLKDKVQLFLRLNPDEISPLPPQARDVRGVRDLGDLELTLFAPEDFEAIKHLINDALKYIGG